MVNLGNISVADLRLGAARVKAAYLEGRQVWGEEEPVPPVAVKSLKFTATQANSTVALSSLNGYQGTYLSSGDGVAFSPYAMNGVVSLDNVGDSVWFKAGAVNVECTGDDNTGNWSGPRFVGTGRLSVDGWFESLTRADEADWYSYEKAYCALFRNNGAIEKVVARGEFLRASQGTGGSGSQQFRNAFRNCSALTSIEFPDILSASGSSSHTNHATGMFQNAFCLDDSLQVVRFPNLEYSRSNAFWAACENDPALLSVEFPSMTSALDDVFFGIFNGNVGAPKVVVLSAFESVPGLRANSGEGWKTLDSETSVVIPDALYDQWTATRYWSQLSVTYVKASEFLKPAAEPLRFTALAADSSVALSYGGSDSQYTAPSLEYSTDGQSWSEYQLGQAVALQSPGDYVIMRATASNRFSTSRTNYFKFSGAGQLRASGDATTLLEPDGSVLSAPDTVFHKLFQGCSMLKDVADLKFPSLSVGQESYNNMFNGAGISAAPELPATTLGVNCYGNMFQACRSLVKASDLPAGQLVQYCYQGMYKECTALRDGPRIMATSSTDNNQLDYMFYRTSILSSVEVRFTTWPSAIQWMEVVGASGTFTCPAELPDVRGVSNIPSGWTKVDIA